MEPNNFTMEKGLALLHAGDKAVTDWRNTVIDLSRPVQPLEPLLIQTSTEIPMLHRRNISTIAASAKVGKTFLISAIAAATLHKDTFLDMYCPKENMKVLFVDTEQDSSDTQIVAQRVHTILHWPTNESNPSFTALNLREYATAERLSIIEAAIIDLVPDMVLIDGVVDLVDNFNDIVESRGIIMKLAKWSSFYNCHICVALHVNKGTNELRGHLGAFLKQKGELILLLTKVEGSTPYIEAKPIDSRHRPIDGFCFRINVEALPELYAPEPKAAKSPKLDKLFSEILPIPTSLNYSDLKKKVMEIGNVKVSMAEKRINQATKSGIIVRSEAGFYHLPVNEISDENLPF